jgi:hypothetical protein
VEKQLKASSKNTPIEAGAKDSNKPEPSAAEKDALMDAVDRIFAEFELVYHNQYCKAFPNAEKLIYAKKLWFSYLVEYSPERIVQAARRAIKESEFLPTVKTLIQFCEIQPQELGLPDAHAAYIEACQASSPKNEHNWSHPAVYFAGRESDWFFLASNTEAKAYPVFKRNYELLCERVLNGEQLDLPVPKALPEEVHKPLSNAERKEKLQELRKSLDL